MSDVLGTLGDIFTGGFKAATDIAVARYEAKGTQQTPYYYGGDGNAYPQGVSSTQAKANSYLPVLLIGGAVLLVAVLALRR